MKANKYKYIAHKLGHYDKMEQCYGEPLRTGLQGLAMDLIDIIEIIESQKTVILKFSKYEELISDKFKKINLK